MEAFFEPWIARLDELHSDLLAALSHRPHLVASAFDAVLVHYREYRDAKARLASADVLRALSHSWLTPFESTFLWVAGWKPSFALRLLPPPAAGGYCSGNPRPLSPDQWRAVEELRDLVVAAEHCISEHLAGAQEAMLGHAVLEAMRGGARNGDALAASEDTVVSALRAVVRAAEELRDATLGRVLAILTPAQAGEFLAAAAELLLRVHRWGMRRNAQ